MKLLIIYGPPAAGKLTVAREIAKRTGFKVFHNHLSIDALTPIFEFGTAPFQRFVRIIRLETIAEAARQNTDLIFTACYGRGVDEENMEAIAKAAEDNGGEVCHVLLVCDHETLERRIVPENRKEFGKTKSVESLRRNLASYDFARPFPAARRS